MWVSVLLALLSVSECSVITGRVGQSVTLSCRYDIKTNRACHICWGRGEIPWSKCNNQVISTDGNKVTQGDSRKYRLSGSLDRGDVSLTILNLSESDAGRYGCRVEIPGWFNDQKHHFELRVMKGHLTSTVSRLTPPSSSPSRLTPLSSSPSRLTSPSSSPSSSSMKVSSGEIRVLVLAVFGLEILIIPSLILVFTRRRSDHIDRSQQQDLSTVWFSLTSSTLQLHRQSSAVENIHQIDREEYTTVEFKLCP